MLKKITIAIIAFLYLGVSSGVAMDIHYCMGKQSGVDFYKSEDNKCGKCGMKMQKNNCCKNQHKFYKLNDSHKNVSNDINISLPVAILVSTGIPVEAEALYHDLKDRSLQNHSPPNDTAPSACIMNCVFRL